jgi:DNA-binding LacI/PurR family transcriptional regulator
VTRTNGYKAPTLREVAAAAEVSVSTASRALAGRPYVKEDVVARVRAAAEQLGYHANEGARGLRSSQTMTLGVVCFQLRQLPMVEFLDGFTAAAEEAGYAMLVANARGSDERTRSLAAKLFERRVDGLVIAGAGDIGSAVRPYREGGVPLLATMSRGAGDSEIPMLMTSEFEAIRAAFARLREFGHSSVAYLGTSRTVYTPRPSYFTQASAEHGITCHMTFFPEGTEGEAMAGHLVNTLSPPTLVTALAVNHSLLAPFMTAVRKLELRIPDDISVFTMSDYRELDAFLDPPLSAVHSDGLEMGRRSAETIIRWIESGAAPPSVSDASLTSWLETRSISAPAAHFRGSAQANPELS